jgi:hypothetical protein
MGWHTNMMVPTWLLATIIVWFTIWSVLGPWVGIRICSAHWQCPIKARKINEDWVKDLKKARGET